MASLSLAQNSAGMDAAPARAERRGFVPRRRLPRAALACQMCRIRKSKCDQGRPSCSACLDHRLTCSYPSKKEERNWKSKAIHGTQTRLATTPSSLRRTDPTPVQRTRVSGTEQHLTGAASDGVMGLSQVLEDGHRPNECPLYDPLKNLESELGESSVEKLLSGLTEVNPYTRSTEFFGPSSNNVFLLALVAKSQAKKGSSDFTSLSPESVINEQTKTSTPGRLHSASLVSLLHNEDYPMVSRPPTPEQHPGDLEVGDEASTRESPAHTLVETTLLTSTSTSRVTGLENVRPGLEPNDLNCLTSHRDKASSRIGKVMMERECIHQYFQNIHYIIPFIDKVAFLQRCEAEVWTMMTQPEIVKQEPRIRERRSGFLSLFNAVCALGAITAPNEPLFSSFVKKATDTGLHKSKFAHISPPMRVAKVYFERVKLNLGDVFEYSCLESVQALFLMSVFCQQALRPHSCYMYSSMAVRAAISIGMAGCESQTRSSESSKTWWCIYNHEIEICCSSGRDHCLKPVAYYQISLASSDNADTAALPDAIIYAMVPLTEILRKIFGSFYEKRLKKPGPDLILTAQKFDKLLREWQEDLPPFLSFEQSDPIQGWAIDQKMVLKLRFYNAQILLHRPFLPLVKFSDSECLYKRHFEVCIHAAENMLESLHVSYIHRPYLRNWWHHITYILCASTTILYALFLDISDNMREEMRKDIEKSLLLLKFMDNLSVARKSSQMIQEVVEISDSQAANVSFSSHRFASLSNQEAPFGMSLSSATAQHGDRRLSNTSLHHVEPASGEDIDRLNPETGRSVLEAPLHHESAFPMSFDGSMLECLIDFDILNHFSQNSPLGSAGNLGNQDLPSYDDSIFEGIPGLDACRVSLNLQE